MTANGVANRSRLVRLAVSPLGVFIAAFLALATMALQWYQPAPPRGFEVDVVFPRGHAGLSEPLVVSGETGAGDFFFVRYTSETSAVLGHERWGSPSTLSAAFEVRPGERRRLRLELPALAHTRGGSRGGGDEVRVSLDGQEVFRATTRFYLRKSSQVFFAENPIGGGTCSREFSGWIYGLDGRVLHGNARHVFSWRERIAWWFSDGKWQVIMVLFASAGIVALWTALRAAPGARMRSAFAWTVGCVIRHRWFVGTAVLCAGVFGCVITGGTGRLFFPEMFGDFYDYQAASLLQGRLDVPEPAVSGEAFIVAKKYYGYFGITPALLRLPLVIFDLRFGWWSRSFMLVAFIGALCATYFILREILRLVAPAKLVPDAWMTVLFTLNVGLGSTLFFLSSRAYIYHEATLWGTTFALAATGCTLRYLAAPRARAWLAALLFGLLALHARPPSGLFALVLLSCAALAVAWRSWRRRDQQLAAVLRQNLALPFVCFLGVLSFNGLSYLKFGTFDGAPLKYHVQYHPERLGRIAGKNFHLANLGFDFSAYTWRRNFELRETFPWFYMSGRDLGHYPNSKIDLAEPTLALPYAMPGLVFLAIVGGAIACWRWASLRLPAFVVLVGVGPMAAAMFTAVAISQRYTADFCPWLISLAAIGFMAAEATPKLSRRTFAFLVAPLTVAAMFITIAITIHYQGTGVWGVPDDVTQRYRALRKKADSLFGVTNHEL